MEHLWQSLEQIEDINDRIRLIYEDIQSGKNKFKDITLENSYKLFKLLGGNTSDVEVTSNWAIEYTYEEYIDENGLEFDAGEAAQWDLEGMSIERADETGHYYQTGLFIIVGPGNIKLPFEFDFCEGYVDALIGNPYDTDEDGNTHGIYYYN
jgi:hypothetical protein